MADCRFLDSLTLRSLVMPVSKEEFRARYWEQKPLVLHRANPDFYGDLFTLRDFDEAISRTPDYVKIANATTKKNVSYKSDAAKGLEATLADMRDGGTLALDALHKHNPNLGMLCRLLEAELHHGFQVNLYLTPPNGTGFTPHWDNHDVFILQVLGSKHWKIEKDRRTFPVRSELMGDEARELRGEVMSFTLEQGDLIYIPRGYVHAAECGKDPSLHLTVGFQAHIFEDFLHAAIKAIVLRDPSLREALPLGFMEGTQERVIDRAASALRQATDKDFLITVFDQFRDELMKNFHLDISGQVVDFFEQRPLALDQRVGPRRGIVYRMHRAEDSVRVNFGTRSITFPDFFRDALEFALSIPDFAIRELPGDLEDEERIVFIERLIQEGLVVRKNVAEIRL